MSSIFTKKLLGNTGLIISALCTPEWQMSIQNIKQKQHKQKYHLLAYAAMKSKGIEQILGIQVSSPPNTGYEVFVWTLNSPHLFLSPVWKLVDQVFFAEGIGFIV